MFRPFRQRWGIFLLAWEEADLKGLAGLVLAARCLDDTEFKSGPGAPYRRPFGAANFTPDLEETAAETVTGD